MSSNISNEERHKSDLKTDQEITKERERKSPLQVQESYTSRKYVSRTVKWGRWEGEALGFDCHGFKFCLLFAVTDKSKF